MLFAGQENTERIGLSLVHVKFASLQSQDQQTVASPLGACGNIDRNGKAILH